MTLLILLLSACWFAQDAQAKFGWTDADIVLDYGVDVELGEKKVIIDQAEVGYPFHVDVVWQLHPKDCLIQTLHDQDGDGTPEWQTVSDDQLFQGNPRHAIASARGGSFYLLAYYLGIVVKAYTPQNPWC